MWAILPLMCHFAVRHCRWRLRSWFHEFLFQICICRGWKMTKGKRHRTLVSMFLKSWGMDILLHFLAGWINRCAERSVFTFCTLWQAKENIVITNKQQHSVYCHQLLYLQTLYQIQGCIDMWNSLRHWQQILYGIYILCLMSLCTTSRWNSQKLPQKKFKHMLPFLMPQRQALSIFLLLPLYARYTNKHTIN